MNKPKFDPNQPFDVVPSISPSQEKPKFDPNQAFEVVQPPPVPEEAVEKILSYGSPIKNAATTTWDTAMGLTQGAFMGGADEVGGLFDTAFDIGQRGLNMVGLAGPSPSQVGETLKKQGFTGDIGPSSLGETYREGQEDTLRRFQEAQERSPIAYGASELAGGIGTGIALAGAGSAAMGTRAGTAATNLASKYTPQMIQNFLRSGTTASKIVGGAGKMAAIAAPEGAVYGALSSEGNLSSEDGRSKLAEDIVEGAATGSLLGAGLSVASDVAPIAAKALKNKLGETVADNNLLRQTVTAFKEGTDGINYTSAKQAVGEVGGIGPLALREAEDAKKLRSAFNKADDQLGRNVGNSLQNATDAGVIVDISPALETRGAALQEFVEQNSKLFDDPKTIQNINKMFVRPTKLTPIEARGVISELEAIQKIIERSPDPYTNKMLSTIQGLSGDVSKTLKKDVPEYAQAAKRFAQTRSNLAETIITEGTHQDARKVKDMVGETLESENKLQKQIEKMLLTANRDGITPGNKTLAKLGQDLKLLQNEENLRILRGEVKPGQDVFSMMGYKDADDVLNSIKDAADKSAAMRTAQKTSLVEEGGKMILQRATGLGGVGQGVTARTANTLGRMTKSGKNLGQKIYSYGPEQLMGMANQLKQSQKGSALGQALEEAIQNNDMAKKNAVLFSIMQNPSLRFDVFESDEDGLSLDDNQ